MSKVKTHWINYKKYFKSNWKKVIAGYVIMLCAFFIFYAIDQVTKTLLFYHVDVNAMEAAGKSTWTLNGGTIANVNPEAIFPDSSQQINYAGVFGIRSIWHKGVTFLSTNNIAFIQVVSFIIAIAILLVPLYPSKLSLIYCAFFGILLAGDLGNATDRVAFSGYVKDEFFVPWLDKGTFNFADITVFIGVILIMCTIVVTTIMEIVKEKKEKTENPKS
ncbi:signal peptidase II [Mycoplasma sp. VS299A]|uniref:signal peptidase II n=1 Tax=unclassified Mycoplasma TaxID=2683645 RepID=UPI003AAEFB45